MVAPHYAYLQLNMPGHEGVITVQGNAQHARQCDRESIQCADALVAAAEFETIIQEVAKKLFKRRHRP